MVRTSGPDLRDSALAARAHPHMRPRSSPALQARPWHRTFSGRTLAAITEPRGRPVDNPVQARRAYRVRLTAHRELGIAVRSHAGPRCPLLPVRRRSLATGPNARRRRQREQLVLEHQPHDFATRPVRHPAPRPVARCTTPRPPSNSPYARPGSRLPTSQIPRRTHLSLRDIASAPALARASWNRKIGVTPPARALERHYLQDCFGARRVHAGRLAG